MNRAVARRLKSRMVRDDSDDWMLMRWRCSPQKQPPSTVAASQLTIHCILRAIGQTRLEQRAR